MWRSSIDLLRIGAAKVASCSTAGYKSAYSIENIYSRSWGEVISGAVRTDASGAGSSIPPPSVPGSSSSSGAGGRSAESDKPPFSGIIPIEKLDIQYSKSSGPGGQHVNKVNTKVEVRFNIDDAAWIPDWIKPQLKANQRLRISKEGYLIVSSDKTRKQILNQADCMERIREMIRQASFKPKQPSPEEYEAKRLKFEARAREVLREKRMKSLTKQSRQKPDADSV